MFWMGGLMSLATALGKSGFITWVAKDTAEIIGSAVSDGSPPSSL